MNKNKDNKQAKNRISVEDILESIFGVSLLVRIVCRNIPGIPESISDVLTPVSFIVGGTAILALVVLWICSMIKKKKEQAV